MDWFLYDNGLRLEMVKQVGGIATSLPASWWTFNTFMTEANIM